MKFNAFGFMLADKKAVPFKMERATAVAMVMVSVVALQVGLNKPELLVDVS